MKKGQENGEMGVKADDKSLLFSCSPRSTRRQRRRKRTHVSHGLGQIQAVSCNWTGCPGGLVRVPGSKKENGEKG